jgi:hypothetical protein
MNNNEIKQSALKGYFANEINIIEYSPWIAYEIRGGKTIYERVIQTESGFVKIKYGSGSVPDRTDALIFYYLLMCCQQNHTNVVKVSRYQICQDCNLGICGQSYDKIEKAADKYMSMHIIANNCWFDGKKYRTVMFQLVNSFKYDQESDKIVFELNEDFMKIMNDGILNFIKFDDIKQLKKPVAMRLYELFVKNLTIRNNWKISIAKLAVKLTLNERYQSRILYKINDGLAEINEKLDTKYAYKTEKGKDGLILIFYKKKLAPSLSISQQKIIDDLTSEAEQCYIERKRTCINIQVNNFANLDHCKYCPAKLPELQ